MLHALAIDELETARVALQPLRVRILSELREPATCADLAERFETSAQRMNGHLKALLERRLIRIVRRRKVRNLTEATYQAVARAFSVQSRLLRPPVDAETYSLHRLLEIAETVQDDVQSLLARPTDDDVPSLSFEVSLRLENAEARKRFAEEVLAAVRPVVERFQRGPASEAYTLRILTYPQPKERARP